MSILPASQAAKQTVSKQSVQFNKIINIVQECIDKSIRAGRSTASVFTHPFNTWHRQSVPLSDMTGINKTLYDELVNAGYSIQLIAEDNSDYRGGTYKTYGIKLDWSNK